MAGGRQGRNAGTCPRAMPREMEGAQCPAPSASSLHTTGLSPTEGLHRLRHQRQTSDPTHAPEQAELPVPHVAVCGVSAFRVHHHGHDRPEHHRADDEGEAGGRLLHTPPGKALAGRPPPRPRRGVARGSGLAQPLSLWGSGAKRSEPWPQRSIKRSPRPEGVRQGGSGGAGNVGRSR